VSPMGNGPRAENRAYAVTDRRVSIDGNGNLLSDGTTTYTWDARDRLTSTTGSPASGYDPSNLRVSMGGQKVLLDGIEEAREYGTNNLRYDHDPSRVDGLLAQKSGASKGYFVTDALGSVYAVVDSTGAEVSKYGYDVYGARTATSDGMPTNWGFTGRRHDGVTEMYYRARYLDGATGRFAQPDPQRRRHSPDGQPYQYVLANPVLNIDPSGEIQITGGVFNWKYPAKERWIEVEFGPPPDDDLDFLIPAIRLVEGAVIMPNCARAFAEGCATKNLPKVSNNASYLADQTTIFYASPKSYGPGGAMGLGLPSTAVPMNNPPNGIAVAYTIEAKLEMSRQAQRRPGFWNREFMAAVIIHEMAHYANVLTESKGGTIIDLSNPRTSDPFIEGVVRSCLAFVP
jgi:RHS repeat-associated protein